MMGLIAPFTLSRIQSLVLMAIFAVTLSFGSVHAASDSIAEEHGAVDHAIDLPIEEAHDGDDHGAGAHHEEIDGLPQLDFSTYTSQIFWLFIAFTILYLYFAKKTLPEISTAVETRREKIEGDLDGAQELKDEAEKVQAEYEAALKEARDQASETFKAAEDDIKVESDKKLEAFKERAAKLAQQTEGKIQDAKEKAMGDTQSIAAEIATIAAEKIVGIPADLKKAEDLVKNINKKAA